jgi:hypothetical protein
LAAAADAFLTGKENLGLAAVEIFLPNNVNKRSFFRKRGNTSHQWHKHAPSGGQPSEASSRPAAPAGAGASEHLGPVRKPALHLPQMFRWPSSSALMVHK